MRHYISPAKAAAQAAEAVVFAAFREKIRAIDPDAIAPDGTIIGRNAATGELEPNATRTSGWAGEPQAAVQGFVIPVPEDAELQLDDPADVGVEEVAHINPWPAPAPFPGADDTDPLAELPEWVEPTDASTAYPAGMWVKHNGAAYECITPGLTVEPEPASTVWRISPTPLFTLWSKPTSYANAYAKDAVVQEGGKFYRSTYDGNDQTPGTDPRYWVEVEEPTKPAVDWADPVPGDGSTLFEQGDLVNHEGKKWKSTKALNASTPGKHGWTEVPAA